MKRAMAKMRMSSIGRRTKRSTRAIIVDSPGGASSVAAGPRSTAAGAGTSCAYDPVMAKNPPRGRGILVPLLLLFSILLLGAPLRADELRIEVDLSTRQLSA